MWPGATAASDAGSARHQRSSVRREFSQSREPPWVVQLEPRNKHVSQGSSESFRSKWNKIEHRLFSHISMNWRGRPLISHEVIVNLIAATTTKNGLRVHAEHDQGIYPTKVQVSDAERDAIGLLPHDF